MKTKVLFLILIAVLPSVVSLALSQEPTDSIDAQILNEVVVEANLQSVSATKSTYIPTSRQKNAAQTGTDLLSRMAIPQLSVIGDNVSTAGGQSVSLFIDFLPASEQDIQAMRMADVKRVEYYDYPSDPRFQGATHVVNFIMQKYDYGGYFKVLGKETFVSNISQLSLFSKFQYKKMTYDIALGGYYSYGSHDYSNSYETYRLLQLDGTLNIIERNSVTTSAQYRRNYFWPTFKAVYQSDNITMENTLGANLDNYPKENSSGSISFIPADYPQTDFINDAHHKSNSLTYKGNWYFNLPYNNSITFRPYYSYSHNTQSSLYQELQSTEYDNGSTDDTHDFQANLQFQHSFGKYGDLFGIFLSNFISNRTNYFGTAQAFDRQKNLRLGPAVKYSYRTDKFYGLIAVGLNYDYSNFNDITEKSSVPLADLFLQYSFNDKNQMSAEFHHMSSMPSSGYRSDVIIQSNPLMSYTGNPYLKPYKTYDVGLFYTMMPTKKFSFTAFATMWTAIDRYAFLYEPSSEGILRSIGQPVGGYTQVYYGLNASLRLLNNSLILFGRFAPNFIHDGYPANTDKHFLNYWLQAQYFVKGWNFEFVYMSRTGQSDGPIPGSWTIDKDYYWATIGWGNQHWNIKGIIANIFRWNWKQGTKSFRSQYYDYTKEVFSQDYHAYFQVSLTYTFGFGKKIERGNEAEQQTGASSGILK